MFPGFGIPDAAIRGLLWAAVAGFPVALAFGWLFEIGPGGIHRTAPAEAGEAAGPQPLTRRDYLILAAFAAIAVVLVYRAAQDVRETPKDSPAAEVSGTAPASGSRTRSRCCRSPTSARTPPTSISATALPRRSSIGSHERPGSM